LLEIVSALSLYNMTSVLVQAGHQPIQFSFSSPRTRPFPTLIHIFAQPGPPISVDARNHKYYLARQIEPESPVTLRLSFEGASAERQLRRQTRTKRRKVFGFSSTGRINRNR
jgi:hypothetical protein